MTAYSRWPTAWLVSLVFAVPVSWPAVATSQTPTEFHKRGLDRARLHQQYDEAIADFNDAIRLGPKQAHFHYARGEAYVERANIRTDRGEADAARADRDQAIADFNEAIRLGPNKSLYLVGRGCAWVFKGEADKAIADFTEAIRLDPKNANGYWQRGRAWEGKGDPDKATSDFRQAEILEGKSSSESHSGFKNTGEWFRFRVKGGIVANSL